MTLRRIGVVRPKSSVKQADAVITVIEQAERVCKDWSRAA
jgi:hypothetical protein